MALIAVAAEALVAGSPLPYALYDAQGRQLFRQGAVIESEALLVHTLAAGVFRQEGGPMSLSGMQGNRYPLDAAGVQIGDAVQLEHDMTGGGQQVYGAELLGFLRGRGVIVTLPMRVPDGQSHATDALPALSVQSGMPLRVRLFTGKNCHVFDTRVLQARMQPYPHLHLAYPEAVTGLTQRRHARVSVNLAASVVPAHGNPANPPPAVPAMIHDLSAKGALLVAQSLLGKEGGQVTLKFRLRIEGIDHIYVLAARLCRISSETGSQPPLYRHGVEFLEMDAHNLATRARRSWQTFMNYLENKGRQQ